MAEASCTQVDPDLWFPEVGQTASAAKKICADCPVRKRCADHAVRLEGDISERHRYGVWGGLAAPARAGRDEMGEAA
jgi:WhiB family redox-sensing transcriptional regulator